MRKALRVAVLSAVIAVTAAPVFADPGGTDPPPPPHSSGDAVIVLATLAAALGL
jgi:hypothetical protein